MSIKTTYVILDNEATLGEIANTIINVVKYIVIIGAGISTNIGISVGFSPFPVPVYVYSI